MNREAHQLLRSHKLALISSVIGLIWLGNAGKGMAQISPVSRALSPFHKQILSMDVLSNAHSAPGDALSTDTSPEIDAEIAPDLNEGTLKAWTQLPASSEHIVDCSEYLPSAHRYATALAGIAALITAVPSAMPYPVDF